MDKAGVMEVDQLLRRCLRGEEAAIQAVFDRYKNYVLRVAWLMLGDMQEAEDATQEAFDSAFRSLGSYRGNASFETWLYQIIINRCRSKLRRKQLLRIPWMRFAEEPIASASDQQPEAIAIAQEERREILNAVRSLSPRLREVVVLYYYRDCSCSEISTITGVNEATVRVRLHRARQQLQTILRAHEVNLGADVLMEHSQS